MTGSLLERHLDLAPLRGRRRGVTHCLFHGEDKRPSLSVDLDRGLFNCFACGEHGGLRRFGELVGEATGLRAVARRPETDRERARREIARRNVAEARRAAAWAPWTIANATIRIRRAAIDEARRWAQTLGPDHPRTWPVLELAARLETQVLADEAQLDALLEEGRLHLDSFDAVEPILSAVAGQR